MKSKDCKPCADKPRAGSLPLPHYRAGPDLACQGLPPREPRIKDRLAESG